MPNPNVGFINCFVILTTLGINTAMGITCETGYYGTTSCTKCPPFQSIPGTSPIGATKITECYISKNTVLSDNTGAYQFFRNDCYYVQDSGTGDTICGNRYIIKEKLFDILSDQTGQTIDSALITDDTELSSLMKDLLMDSLAVVEFIMAIEEEFDISIPEDDYPKFITVNDLIEYIYSKCG